MGGSSRAIERLDAQPLADIYEPDIGVADKWPDKRLPKWINSYSNVHEDTILAVAIIAAVLTPTPDVFNMSLMGLPLYVLFEIGLIGMRLGKK